jgi:SAM-dependent MidA family methyltransferase
MTTPLEPIIKALIAQTGPIDLGTYMALCLTHPDHGYYTTRADVIGTNGDFTTAPEISQLFGEMIGFWIADLWGQMGRPPFHLIELGPGRGTLMADILRILDRINGMNAQFDIHLVECSERMIAHQSSALYPRTITWHDCIDDLPRDRPWIVIANEFFDALPIRQWVWSDNQTHEVVIGTNDAGELHLGRVPSAASADLAPTAALPVREGSPASDAAAHALFTALHQLGGAALLIDYGYEEPPGRSTLQAVRAHQRVDGLAEPGCADLTAHVDFGRLAALARASGVNVAGPTTQGSFLQQLGIEARARAVLHAADDTQRQELIDGMTRLVDPRAMGSLFKVMCVYQGGAAIRPEGFGS